jgi:hypothetical protein
MQRSSILLLLLRGENRKEMGRDSIHSQLLKTIKYKVELK